MTKISSLIPFLFIVLLISSCVSSKVHKQLQADKKAVDEELVKYKKDHNLLLLRNMELVKLIETEKQALRVLESDTADLITEIRKAKLKYEELSETCEQLISDHSSERKKLMLKLKDKQDDIHEREDELSKMESALVEKGKTTKYLNDSLRAMQRGLLDREIRVKELETILYRKDSAVNVLKGIVSHALLGFKDKGLSVQLKNGKVYILMEEDLLFKSGSAVVDIKGQEALAQLAKVLTEQSDIDILIEGHTDDIPFQGAGQLKDNWDLSAKRATSVVRILTKNGVNPTQLTAAGRGEHVPLDPEKSTEARKKNRRIEIILSPKLDELFELLEAN